MPVVQTEKLMAEITQSKARWVANETWLHRLTEDQRKSLLGVRVDLADMERAKTAPPAAFAPSLAALPPSVDWRNKDGRNFISPIKNQGGCGSCVSFCTVAQVEAMAAVERNEALDLSEADLHFCSSHGANCGGWWPSNALDEVRDRGVVDEASFPYGSAFAGGAAQCLVVPQREEKAYKLTGYDTFYGTPDRKRWLAEVGPLSAVLHVYDDFFSYVSGVYSHVSGGEAGYHCVEVVGYSDQEGCWICKNSWGAGWGDGGFFKIAYGQCGIDDQSTDVDSGGHRLNFSMWGLRGVVPPQPAVPALADICASRNADGRLEVFARAVDNSVWNIWQTRPHAGPWSHFSPLGGLVKQLQASLNSDGRLEIFGIGMDDALWNDWQTAPHAGPWSGWNQLGGGVKKIASARNSDGRLEVFAIGMDDALWNIWQTIPHAGPWSGWNPLGGGIKDLTAALNSDGRLEVFAIGMDDALWNIWQTAPHSGPWSEWNSLGGGVKKIASARNSDGRLEVFAIGMDDGLWNIWQTIPHAGPWSVWNSLGGIVKDIAVARNSDGRLEVFGIGQDDGLWNMWQTVPHAGPWSGWNSLGGRITQVEAVLNTDGRLEVFGIGMDGALWNMWQTVAHAGPWSGWNRLNEPAAAPAPAAPTVEELEAALRTPVHV